MWSNKNSIYGIYGIIPFSYYNFYFSICDIEDNSNCYEKEEIQSILSNVYLDIRTIDYAIKSYKKDVDCFQSISKYIYFWIW